MSKLILQNTHKTLLYDFGYWNRKWDSMIIYIDASDDTTG